MGIIPLEPLLSSGSSNVSILDSNILFKRTFSKGGISLLLYLAAPRPHITSLNVKALGIVEHQVLLER